MSKTEIDFSNLLTPVVCLDTNVIRGASEGSTPFQILRELALAGSIRVVIPKIVLEERRTQWRERYSKHIESAKKSLSILVSELSFLEHDSIGPAVEELNAIDIEQISKNRYQEYIKNNGFTVMELSIDAALAAWEGYFSGEAPYKEIKNRSDIPDAHIIASVVEIVKNSPSTYFVAGDNAMYEAANKLEGLESFSKLEDLIESDIFVELRAQLDAEKKWQKVKSLVSDSTIKEKVAEYAENYGSDHLEWLEISDPAIPEDNHTALIQSYGEPYAVSVGNVEDWGAGYLRCIATYHVEALLSFSVFRSDAFDVPDWVSVTIGDFEKDHYFEAEGYRELEVKVPISVKIDVDAISSPDDKDIYEVAIEESESEVRLSDDQN